MQSGNLDYDIQGGDAQFVQLSLAPGAQVVAEAGALLWMDEAIAFETRFGDGSGSSVFGSLISAGKRMLSGEGLVLTHFENTGGRAARLALGASLPGTIVPVDLRAWGGELLCQDDAFLAAVAGTEIGIAFNRRISSGFFGEGFVLQRLRGDGMAFLHAGGALREIRLEDECLRLDSGCLVAFEPTLDYSVELAGGLKTMLFGGEGLALTTLSGRGRVLVQSLPINRLARNLYAHMPQPEHA